MRAGMIALTVREVRTLLKLLHLPVRSWKLEAYHEKALDDEAFESRLYCVRKSLPASNVANLVNCCVGRQSQLEPFW